MELQKLGWLVETKLIQIDGYKYDTLSDAHEAVLEYIYQLLKQGKLKIRRVIQHGDPEYPGRIVGITDTSGPVPIRTYENAEDAIEDLRFVWQYWTDKGDPGSVEISTQFALPEMPWQP